MMAPGPEPMMADDRARVRRTTVVRRPIAPGPTVRRTTVVGKRHLLGDDDEDEDEDEDHDDHDHDHDHDMTAATNAANEAMMEEFSDFQDAVIDPMVEELAPSPDALFADDRYFRRTTVVRRRPITGRRVRRTTTVIGKRHLLSDDEEEEEEDENEDDDGDEEGNDETSPEDQTAVDSLTAEMTAATNAAKEAMMGASLDVDAELEDGMMAPGPEPMMADDRARVRRTTVVRRPIAPGPTVQRTTVVGKRHLLGDDDEDEDDEEDHDDHDHDHDMTAATNAANEAMMEEFSDFQDAVIDPMVEELAPSPEALFADDRYFRRTTVVRRR